MDAWICVRAFIEEVQRACVYGREERETERAREQNMEAHQLQHKRNMPDTRFASFSVSLRGTLRPRGPWNLVLQLWKAPLDDVIDIKY